MLYKIICGKGHHLNELVNRCIKLAIQKPEYDCLDDSNSWNLYPGPLGLYARHNDFFGLTDDPDLNQILYHYKDHVRNPMANVNHKPDETAIQNLIKMLIPGKNDYTFYINATENHYPIVANLFKDQKIYTSKLSLEFSNKRHHHLMMEYSIGAAESRDYSQTPTLQDLCRRLEKMENSDRSITLPDNFVVVDTNKLLECDFSELFKVLDITDNEIIQYKTNVLTMAIDQYNLYNIAAHPLLVKINSMNWQEILETAYPKGN